MYQAVIVDDELFVVEGIKTAIDWSGYNFELCYCTTNPYEALDYLTHHPADLLITDISMPQMNGIQLIQKVKELNPLISILVLSAYDNFKFVRSAMRYGAENYLLKPLDPNELMESISHIAAHIQERVELSETYGSTMLTFRSNFIESWVKFTLCMDDFLSRAELLGINLHLDNYTVLIFSIIPTYSQGNLKMAGLFDYILSLFVGTYISHFYFEIPTRLVCIISTTRSSNSINVLLGEMNKARIVLDFPFFLSVGNTVDNFEDVSESYRNASKYLSLQYSSITQITTDDINLSVAAVNTIERDYSSVAEDLYLEQISSLFASISTSRKKSFLLSVLSWGIAQVLSNTQSESKLTFFSETILDNSEDETTILTNIHGFVHACYEILATRQKSQVSTYPYVDAIISTVHEFSDNNISLKTLAAKMGMHPSYLGSIFHQQTGYYFNDYLNEERLKYAAGLIENTDMKLKDIVEKAGFSSQTYFNRQFKRKYGTSPNIYRKELKIKSL